MPPPPTPAAVLAVDDDEAVLRVVQALVGHLGVPCRGAVGGAAAIESYRRNGSDIALVLLDVLMPDLDGPAVLAGLRGSTRRCGAVS